MSFLFFFILSLSHVHVSCSHWSLLSSCPSLSCRGSLVQSSFFSLTLVHSIYRQHWLHCSGSERVRVRKSNSNHYKHKFIPLSSFLRSKPRKNQNSWMFIMNTIFSMNWMIESEPAQQQHKQIGIEKRIGAFFLKFSFLRICLRFEPKVSFPWVFRFKSRDVLCIGFCFVDINEE